MTMEKKKLKVIFILISYSIGGAEKRYTNLFNFLSQKEQNEYKLLISRNLYDLLLEAGFNFYRTDHIFVLGIKISSVAMQGNPKRLIDRVSKIIIRFRCSIEFLLNKFIIIIQVHWFLHQEQPDILHGILRGVNILAGIRDSKVIKIGSYVHAREMIPEYQRKALAAMDALDILVKPMRDMLIRNGFISERLYVAPCSFTDYSRTYIAKKKRNVLFLARFIECKHPEMFIDMLRFIPWHTLYSAKFVMMGSGPMYEQVKELGQQYIKKNILEITGYIANPIEYLAEGIIFVQTTDCEAHGTQSLLEAMACGNAVVTTDVLGIEEIVTPDVGFRVEHSPGAFAEKVNFLLNNFELAVRMGERARQRVICNQNIGNYAEYLENLYMKTYLQKR